MRDKTTYLPGLSRAHICQGEAGDTILVVGGRGGRPFKGADLAAAAIATPDKKWRAIGPVTAPDHLPSNLTNAGWVETAAEEIASAGIVIGHAGDGLVSAVIAAGRPFICLPQPRPFDEQMVKARRLEALGVAIVLETWPPPIAWPGLLRRAQNLDPNVSKTLHDPDGAARAANLLQSLAS